MALTSIPPRGNQTNQSSIPLIPNEEDVMAQAQVPNVDSVICHEVARLVSCPLDELAQRLSVYSWAQVFAAVDRLSRQGTLQLSRTSCFGYVLSMCSDPSFPSLRETGEARHFADRATDPSRAEQ
jgi:hypothetical protein